MESWGRILFHVTGPTDYDFCSYMINTYKEKIYSPGMIGLEKEDFDTVMYLDHAFFLGVAEASSRDFIITAIETILTIEKWVKYSNAVLLQISGSEANLTPEILEDACLYTESKIHSHVLIGATLDNTLADTYHIIVLSSRTNLMRYIFNTIKWTIKYR